jgi:hypothetical protein
LQIKPHYFINKNEVGGGVTAAQMVSISLASFGPDSPSSGDTREMYDNGIIQNYSASKSLKILLVKLSRISPYTH